MDNIITVVNSDNSTNTNTEGVYILTDEYGRPMYGYPVQ